MLLCALDWPNCRPHFRPASSHSCCYSLFCCFAGQSGVERQLSLAQAGWRLLLSLLIQSLSPGVAIRGARYGLWIEDPLRDSIALVSRTSHHVAILVSDSEVFAGFFLLLAFALLLTLSCFRSNANSDRALPLRFTRGPMLLGLALQLIAIPLLWLHTSDHPIFFGRFSAGYMIPVTLNALFILGFAGALWQRRRINQLMTSYKLSPTSLIVAGIALISLVFLMTQTSQHTSTRADLSRIQLSWLASRIDRFALAILACSPGEALGFDHICRLCHNFGHDICNRARKRLPAWRADSADTHVCGLFASNAGRNMGCISGASTA